MGGLANYADACDQFLRELRESLSDTEVSFLRSDCASMGRGKWIDWISFDVFRAGILAFVAAPPSRRRAMKLWKDPRTKGHLVLAAYHHVWRAKKILALFHEHPISPGGSYREMSLVAGLFYERAALLCNQEFAEAEWPFDGRNPFEG